MTAFAFAILLTVVMTGIIALYARRRPVGSPLSWGEAFIGALFVFAYMLVLYGVLPNAWLQWCDGPLKWRSDKIGIPLGLLHHWRVNVGSTHIFTLNWLRNGHKYLGFLPVDKGLLFPHGITFFGRGKVTFTAQDMRDIVATVIYGVVVVVNVKGWQAWQARGKTKVATPELSTSAYGRPLVRKV